MNELAISTRDLVKQFKAGRSVTTAVDRLSLQVRPGETYGLIGPDGAGKTTATRAILGLLIRTSGESSILGFDSMRDSYQLRGRVGYIAQQFALPPNLTVMENMHFFADLHGVNRQEQKKRIPELLSFAGLSDFNGRLAGKLSGGMKKKLALACSLIHAPQVVMLDEPTLGVDPVSRREFWSLLGNLRAETGLTIFACTPYMDEAERCTQIGLMVAGRLIASGTPAAIKALLPGHMLEFTPSAFAPAVQVAGGVAGVLEVQTYGDKLHVLVEVVDRDRSRLAAALAAQGIRHDEMREIEIRMEEAFISLIRRQASGAGQPVVVSPAPQAPGGSV
jgi:ABC-2 type transport system ATP-binding protein